MSSKVWLVLTFGSRLVAVLVLLSHLHLLGKGVELCVCWGLRQAVGNHLASGHGGQFDLCCLHLILDVLVLDVDVLGPGVEYWVVSQSKGSLVVTLERDGGVSVAGLEAVEVAVDCLHARVLAGDLDLSVMLICF